MHEVEAKYRKTHLHKSRFNLISTNFPLILHLDEKMVQVFYAKWLIIVMQTKSNAFHTQMKIGQKASSRSRFVLPKRTNDFGLNLFYLFSLK